MPTIVGYCRVSTDDQNLDAQTAQLSEVARSRGCTLAIRTETASGRRDRPVLDQVEREARQGRVSQLWVTALDRLGRSTLDVLMRLDRLHRAGCAVVALREGLDLSSAAGRFQAQLLAAFAEFEAELIRRRTVEGLAAARARGRRLGRPPRRLDLERVRELRDAGASWREVAEQLNVPLSTVQRVARLKIPPSGDDVPVAS